MLEKADQLRDSTLHPRFNYRRQLSPKIIDIKKTPVLQSNSAVTFIICY